MTALLHHYMVVCTAIVTVSVVVVAWLWVVTYRENRQAAAWRRQWEARNSYGDQQVDRIPGWRG